MGTKKQSTSNPSLVKAYKERTSPKPLTYRITNLNPSKLRENMVSTGILKSILYKGEEIEIEQSWLGLSILLLSYTFDCYPKLFLKALERGQIMSQNFDVMRRPPTYNSLGNSCYGIPGTPYSLLTNLAPSAIVKAISGFPEALEIEDEDLLLNINPSAELDIERWATTSIAITSDIITLDELLATPELLPKLTYKEVYFWDKKIKTSNIPDLTIKVIKQAIKKQSNAYKIAESISIPPLIGISNDPDIQSITVIPISGSNGYSYYTNEQPMYPIAYLANLITALGLPISCIKFRAVSLSLTGPNQKTEEQ